MCARCKGWVGACVQLCNTQYEDLTRYCKMFTKKIVQCVQVVGKCLCPAAAARPRGGGAECGRRSPLSAAAAAHREATTGSEKQVSTDTLHCEPTSGHCWRHRAGDTEKQGDIGHIVKQRQNR